MTLSEHFVSKTFYINKKLSQHFKTCREKRVAEDWEDLIQKTDHSIEGQKEKKKEEKKGMSNTTYTQNRRVELNLNISASTITKQI